MEKRFVPEGAVLVDASTIDLLASHTVYHALTGDYFSDRRIADILHGILRKQVTHGRVASDDKSDAYALNHALSFLEQWVLADEMFVDVGALNSLKLDKDKVRQLSGLFQKTLIPKEVNAKAADSVSAFYRFLDASNDPLFRSIPMHGALDYDLCLKDGFYGEFSAILAVSGNTRARSVFYLQLSREQGVPLFLHPRKSRFLSEIGQTFEQSSMASYEMLTDEIRNRLSYKEWEVPIPPIADEIIRVARKAQTSLVAAAEQVRSDAKVGALRDYLSKIWKTAVQGGKASVKRRIVREAEEVARSIESKWGTSNMISRRQIKFAELPVIGNYLKFIGWEPLVTVPDVVLQEKPYVALFSRWANEVELEVWERHG